MIKRISLSLLIFLFVIGSVSAFAEDEAITVGNVGYSAELVQRSADSFKLTYLAQGEEIDDEAREEILNVLEAQFTGIGVIENVLIENGLNDLTEEEMTQIQAEAQVQYDELWTNAAETLREEYGDDITDEEITLYLEQLTITLDSVVDELMISTRQTRFVEMFEPDISVTDEEIRSYYDETYVEPYRERYENNIPLFESEILMQGSETTYIPEGYRTIKHILLAIPEDINSQLEAQNEIRTQLEQEKDEAYDALAAAAAANEDTTEVRETYLAAEKAYEDADAEFESIRDSIIPALQDTIDEIYAAIEAGEPFENLMAEYSIDQKYLDTANPGYPFHPASEYWTDEFKEAVLSIKEVGGISEPVLTGAGVSIIKYTGDYSNRQYELSDEEIEELRPYALQEKIDTIATEKVEEYKDNYTVTFNRDLITF